MVNKKNSTVNYHGKSGQLSHGGFSFRWKMLIVVVKSKTKCKLDNRSIKSIVNSKYNGMI